MRGTKFPGNMSYWGTYFLEDIFTGTPVTVFSSYPTFGFALANSKLFYPTVGDMSD